MGLVSSNQTLNCLFGYSIPFLLTNPIKSLRFFKFELFVFSLSVAGKNPRARMGRREERNKEKERNEGS